VTTRSDPPVTIAIPFAATPIDYLELAVRSVFAQSVRDWELLLLADGSQPDLEERLSLIRDSRVRLVRDADNRGLAFRLNQIPRMAAGDIVVRMDADDLMHPERLARTCEWMTRHDVEVMGGRAWAIDAQTEVLGLFREGGLPQDRSGFLRSNAFTHPTVAATRTWFLENPYDETLLRSEDKDLWLRTSAHTRFGKTDEVLLFYRVADLTVSKQSRDAQHDRLLLRRHGPHLVGAPRTTGKVATSFAKQLAFAGLTRVGGQQAIVRRKVTPLDTAAAREARTALETARSAQVPGW
jgi:glycosyltransferase involved in cell wall biosynthesis